MSTSIAERPAALMNFIERASRDDSFNIDKFRELLIMQREADQIAARHEFNVAMSRVQSELQTIVRDRENTHTRSRYATLPAIDAAARPVYTHHGFSVRFGTAAAPWEGWVRVTCEVAHIGGYSEQHHLDGPMDAAGSQGKSNKTGIQAVGSTVSYLRRYLLLLVLNLVTVDDGDDDGNGARRDQQAQVYSRRDEITASTQKTEPPKRTINSFLDELEMTMRECPDLQAVNALIAEADTQRAMKEFTNGAKTRLDGIIASGIGAHAAVTHEQDDSDGWPGPTPASLARERETADASA
jgi:predicted ester cyclase